MNLRKTLLAASIAAFPLLIGGQVLAGTSMMGAPTLQAPQAQAALVARLAAAHRAAYALDSEHGFAVLAHHPGVSGTQINRLAHTYKGVRVFSSESVVVSDNAGNIVSESSSDRRAGLGNGLRTASAFSVTPTLTASAAINKAVGSVFPGGAHKTAPTAELVIYPVMKSVRVASAARKPEAALNALDLVDVVSGYKLAYVVKTRMSNNGKPVYHDTIVNAADGSILAQWKAVQSVIGVGHSQYYGDVPINTTFVGGVYKMLDSTRGVGGTYGGLAITNANHGTTAGSIYTNTTNTWGDGLQYNGGSTTNANGQTAAVNALWGAMNTYDMLKNTLGWQALDGANTAFYIAAHVNTAYDNAYYDDSCKCMYIGDGSSFNSLGSLDVIGHEMSHGVTAATSNLNYFGESGGLNESASDIGGESVEAYAKAGGTGTTIPNTGNDWMMGKEISKDGQPLRWMYKPSLDGSSPNAWSSSVGNLDVHYSSGPNNRMFYFLSQGSNSSSSSNYYSSYLNKSPLAMTGIGTDKAYRIWFKALTTKFTVSTNYADARAKVLQSAQELYGVNSPESIAVQRAYAAINVGADVDESGVPAVLSITSAPASMTVSAGGTATFTVAAGGGTSPYAYQWLRNGSAISGATLASYSLANVQTADSGAVFSAKVTDAANASVTSSGATLTVGTTGGTVLANGVPVTGIALGSGVSKMYTIVVPAGQSSLTLDTSGGSGDADLYVKLGSAPTTSSYLAKSDGATTTEHIAIANPAAGTYYVMVNGYSAVSGVSLVGKYGASSGGGTLLNVTNIAVSSGGSKAYSVVVPAGRPSVTFKTSGGTGDADLYVKLGSPPTTSTYDKVSDGSTTAETITIANPAAGTYNIMIYGYSSASGVTLNVVD